MDQYFITPEAKQYPWLIRTCARLLAKPHIMTEDPHEVEVLMEGFRATIQECQAIKSKIPFELDDEIMEAQAAQASQRRSRMREAKMGLLSATIHITFKRLESISLQEGTTKEQIDAWDEIIETVYAFGMVQRNKKPAHSRTTISHFMKAKTCVGDNPDQQGQITHDEQGCFLRTHKGAVIGILSEADIEPAHQALTALLQEAISTPLALQLDHGDDGGVPQDCPF